MRTFEIGILGLSIVAVAACGGVEGEYDSDNYASLKTSKRVAPAYRKTSLSEDTASRDMELTTSDANEDEKCSDANGTPYEDQTFIKPSDDEGAFDDEQPPYTIDDSTAWWSSKEWYKCVYQCNSGRMVTWKCGIAATCIGPAPVHGCNYLTTTGPHGGC